MRKLTILLVAIISLLTMSCNSTKQAMQVNKYIQPVTLNTPTTASNLLKIDNAEGVWTSISKSFYLYSFNSSVDSEEKIVNGGVYKKNTILGEIIYFIKKEQVYYISGPDEEKPVYINGKPLSDEVVAEIISLKKIDGNVESVDVEFNVNIDSITIQKKLRWIPRYKNDEGLYLEIMGKNDFSKQEIESLGGFVNKYGQIYFEVNGKIFYLVRSENDLYLLPKKLKDISLGQFYLKTDNIDAKKRGRSVSKRTLLLKSN